MPTNPFHVMDLAITLPVAVLAALWLWRGQPWGALLAGALLVFLPLEALSVAVDQTFAHLRDTTYPSTMAPVFAVLALVGLVPLAVYVHAVRRPALAPEPAPARG